MVVEIMTRSEMISIYEKLKADLDELKQTQRLIIEQINQWGQPTVRDKVVSSDYVTAAEFMNAVHIRRWKFDQLIGMNQIQVVKKKRKIYVPIGEIDRFFKDPNVQ